MSKKTIRGAVVTGVTALAVVGLAGPAQADSADVYTTTGAGLMVYYDGPSDDLFKLRNFSPHGYGVRGEIRSSGGTLLSWNYVGADEDSVSWYRDLAKGKDYFMRVCLASGPGDTTPINCAGKVIRDE